MLALRVRSLRDELGQSGHWTSGHQERSLGGPGAMVGSVAIRDAWQVPNSDRAQRHTLIKGTLAVLPYKRHVPSLLDLTGDESKAFAKILSELTIRYDNLFSTSFAYSMGVHQRPIPSTGVELDQDTDDVAHLHLHFSPPLLRSASVRKFLVG